MPGHLPWGALKEKVNFPVSVDLDPAAKPGEFVLQMLFAEFTVLADKKINQLLEPSNRDKPLSKSLQRGEDSNFDQLLSSLASVAENCLPSLLRTFFEWYERQNPTEESTNSAQKLSAKYKGEKDYLSEKRDLAVDFLYCLVLTEVLKQLPYHPGYDDIVSHIINQVFRHFKYKDGVQASANAANINLIADLYAEVNGVLSESRFPAVRKRFVCELRELRSRDQTPAVTQSIVSLLMGMKFFRVKMHPIEELQACIHFLHECGVYFLEVKEKETKHALAGLFVEILLPVAAVAKNEVNVPVLKNFVEMLYTPTLDSCVKKKHSLALFPMVTCLLCVSQKHFFLTNWPAFLTLCLSRLKDKDPKMARVALESLYRLLWVYMIRIKCESNTATTSRLQSIVNSLFPRGSKLIMPRDTPLNIFVKIIQFIAQERRDFAMRDIIYDLLCVGKPTKVFAPERMSIGLRAFLVIADSLQQGEGAPPMPPAAGAPPSGSMPRSRRTFIQRHLAVETARALGVASDRARVGGALDAMLRHLDAQLGRPLLRVRPDNVNREPDEIITGERKPRIDLFRTCVAAIPRLLPEGMTPSELVDLLSRLTVHIDDELGKLAFQSLQNMIVDLVDWRNEIIHGYVHFIERDVLDTFPQLLDQCNRRLISLLTQWKTAVQTATSKEEKELDKTRSDKKEKEETNAENSAGGGPRDGSLPPLTLPPTPGADTLTNTRATLHEVEGFGLVMLCSCKPIIRKLAVLLLKEARNLCQALHTTQARSHDEEAYVLDLMDKCCPLVIEKTLPHLPGPEKTAAVAASPLDFQWLADRTSIIWSSCASYHQMCDGQPAADTAAAAAADADKFDPWLECMSIFMHADFVLGACHSAVAHAWPLLYNRLHTVYSHIDPNTTASDGRSSSILRGSRKVTSERDNHLSLWKTYVMMGCCIALPSQDKPRPISPEPSFTTEPLLTPDRAETRPLPPAGGAWARELFKTLIPLLKCDMVEIREAIVKGLSHTNPSAFRDVMRELLPVIKEAVDRKQENVKRRRRRDTLRLTVVRVFHFMAQNGIFAQCPLDVLDPTTEGLCTTFVEYIEGARLFLESEADKDLPILRQIRFHFSEFVRHLIRNTAVERRPQLLCPDLRYTLFYLFASWSGQFGQTFGAADQRCGKYESCTGLERSAVQAMSVVLSCGPAFDPSGLNDDGYVYAWLDTLLSSHDQMIKPEIYKLAQETIVLLLEFNSEAQTLLDWVIDRCYTGSHEVADGCFNALGVVFNNREYPCDHVAMLLLTLLRTGCARIAVHHTAVSLLRILYKRFFLDDVVLMERDDDAAAATASALWQPLQELLLRAPHSRSQQCLSETLARLHPELTLPILSEITHRLQTSTPSVRQALLSTMPAWLLNVQLVDSHLMTTHGAITTSDYAPPPLKGDGWGSVQATEMVLNNLFYITVKFGDDHTKEIEHLWATLVTCWPGNLQVIIRYLVIITGISPAAMLPYAKWVVVYLGRAKPERLLDEMIIELSTIETLPFHVDRTPTPPFYRLLSVKKVTPSAAGGDDLPSDPPVFQPLDKGQIHTKRHSAEDPSKLAGVTPDISPLTGSLASVSSEVPTVPPGVASSGAASPGPASTAPALSGPVPGVPVSPGSVSTGPAPSGGPSSGASGAGAVASGVVSVATTPVSGSTVGSLLTNAMCSKSVSEVETEEEPVARAACELAVPRPLETSVPYPLPMPAFGGYFAPLSELLPDSGLQANPPLQRCNLAVMLLTDLVVDCVNVDWTVHLPLLLHIIFLGLDHSVTLVHEHCKQLLLNLLLAFSTHGDHFAVAKVLLGNQCMHDDTSLTLPSCGANKDYAFMESSGESSTTGSTNGAPPPPPPPPRGDTLTPDSVSSLVDVAVYDNTQQVAKALIEFLVTRRCEPLWSCEDITPRVHNIRSAGQLAHLQTYVLAVFSEALPVAQVARRWAQEALHLALACSSRHYAGRSFQVFRALHVPLTSGDLSDILSRLVETVAEQGEDMQGYVTEIMLTLEAAVDNLDVDERGPLPRELFLSTPNLKEAAVTMTTSPPITPATPSPARNVQMRKSATFTPLGGAAMEAKHTRSTSCSVSRHAVTSSPPTMETADPDSPAQHATSLMRSRSAQSLHDVASRDDHMTVLAQMVWVGISLLESDFEFEFLLAVRLLDKVLQRVHPDRADCRERLEQIRLQIQWPDFRGVQSLLLKGCTSTLTADATWRLLSRLTLSMGAPVVAMLESYGFPMNVIALLPRLVEHYDEPTPKCIEVAQNISRMCEDQPGDLENLATVMTLYSRRTFAKDVFQWTKCVVKYLHDVYAAISDAMIAFLVEVLDKGPVHMQAAVLQMLHCLLHYVDIASLKPHNIHDLLRVVAQYIENPQWRESLKILKLCVARSSSLEVAPPSAGGSTTVAACLPPGLVSSLLPHTSFAETDVIIKKELPGRTMEFTFDQSRLPIIGCSTSDLHLSESSAAANAECERPTEATPGGTFTNESSIGCGWKRPLLSQSRTRERLVNLLNCYGPRIMIPKSPSVIFSHDSPSDTLERQTTMTNSSDERSLPADGLSGDMKLGEESSTHQQMQALEAFDFLYEDTDISYDFGGLKRDSMKTNDSRDLAMTHHDESSDDETPIEDLPTDLAGYPIISLPSRASFSPLDTRMRHRSASSYSVHSLGSEADPTDSTSPCTSLTFISMQTDDIEEAWRCHVERVMVDNAASHAVLTFSLFARLFYETCRKVEALTREASYFLSKTTSVKAITTQLSTLLELQTSDMECPLVFVDAEAIIACHLMDRLQFTLLTIHESYETYLMRREQTLECLRYVKTAVKHLSLRECTGDLCTEEQKVKLCQCLYQLHFQLLQLYEGYTKLVGDIVSLPKPAQVVDLSRSVARLKLELQKAASDLDLEPEALPAGVGGDGGAAPCEADAEALLLDYIKNESYTNAVQYMRQVRPLFASDMFGVHVSDEIEALLFLHCRQQADFKPGVVVVVNPECDISRVCSHLMQLKLHVSTALSHLESVSARPLDMPLGIDASSSVL